MVARLSPKQLVGVRILEVAANNFTMKKWFKWFTESNRFKHFLYAIPCGAISILFALGLAIGMEFKDYQYIKNWD